MSILFVPEIIPTDYDSFRRILNRDLPNTYNEWLQVARKIHSENPGPGNVTKSVKVDSHEFARFCETTGAETNLHGLMNFAYKKGAGNED